MMVGTALRSRLRVPGMRLLAVADRLLPMQDPGKRAADAAAYWTDSEQPNWRANSHWQDGLAANWSGIGEAHLEMVQALASAAAPESPPATWGRVLEWGSGGGANAVAFARVAGELVAADVSRPSLEECRRQVALVSDTPVRTVLIDADRPELSAAQVEPGSVDLFLSFYVFELLPSAEYALRVLRLSLPLLAPGGLAVIQVKYRTEDLMSRSLRRAYVRNLSNMTTFGIDEFWEAAEQVGYEPVVVRLVPVNALDRRYAYYALRKPVG